MAESWLRETMVVVMGWGLGHYQLGLMILLIGVWGLARHYQAQVGSPLINQNDSPLPEPVPADQRQTDLPELAVPPKKRAARGEFAGVTRLPACPECEAAKKITAVAIPEPPPVISSTRGRPKTIKPEGQSCPNPQCRYYGWLKWGNLSSNGHPNGGPQRQWVCSDCDEYFMESDGTIFYRKRVPTKEISRAITALAEGLGIRAVGRIFEVTPETVLRWLVETEPHLLAFNRYWVRELPLEQVQLDELYGVIRAYQAGEMSEAEAIAALDHPDPAEAASPPPPEQSLWLWTAIDPVSKFWLGAVVGDRGAEQSGQIVH